MAPIRKAIEKVMMKRNMKFRGTCLRKLPMQKSGINEKIYTKIEVSCTHSCWTHKPNSWFSEAAIKTKNVQSICTVTMPNTFLT